MLGGCYRWSRAKAERGWEKGGMFHSVIGAWNWKNGVRESAEDRAEGERMSFASPSRQGASSFYHRVA